LKAGGIWVSPAEVEERLLKHPDVVEAVVVAAPDELGLEKPVACVVAQPGRDVAPDELIDWCRAELAAFKRPRAVVIVDELPKTPTGKIRRNVMREAVVNVLTDEVVKAQPRSFPDGDRISVEARPKPPGSRSGPGAATMSTR
jgi:acyl-coenzyme A synthetase/AMP-(fatty) acid ligase